MTQYTEAPVPGDLFPLLKENQYKEKYADPDPDKDELIFHMVTASMSTPSK